MPIQALPAEPAPVAFGAEVGLFGEHRFLRSFYFLGALGFQTGPELPRVPKQTGIVCSGD